MSEFAGIVAVLGFAGLAMWGLSKLPARLRRVRGNGADSLIRSQSGSGARHR